MIILFTASSVTFPMPIVTVSMYSGRTQREKDRLAETITEDVVKVLNVIKCGQKRGSNTISGSIPWKLVCFWRSYLTHYTLNSCYSIQRFIS